MEGGIMGTERNYARFYALLKQLPGADKEILVEQYTGGRTTHLRQMTIKEYELMCSVMAQVAGYETRKEALRKELRRKRSICLRLMQQLGIDTTDWARVDSFCSHPRIVGKPFRKISLDEFDEVIKKLRMIKRKGGLRPVPKSKEQSSASTIVFVQLNNLTES